jgi:GT2 family glycosyltransferase
MTSIGIVVVTFNSAQVLTACLNSIPMPRNLVVVDNASRDDSVAIAQKFGAQILRNKRNLGFGAACNLGAALSTAPYVLFLNPDAVMADNAISELQKAIELYPAAGGFAPAVNIIGSTRSFRKTSYVQDQGSRYIADAEAPKSYAEVDFIDGAACLYNRDLFLKLGGFDESLFLYFEDDDLSYRMRQSEKKLIYVPQALILHKKKASSGRRIDLVYKRSWHETASRLRLNKKYDIHCDINMERKRARIRLMRALITLNPYKGLRYLGTLRALSAFAGKQKTYVPERPLPAYNFGDR